MSVMWRYLDKRAATIAAVKDYESMQFILNNTDKEIGAIRDKMSGMTGMNMDGMPKVNNPNAGEDRMLSGIEQIDVLKERYRQAQEYWIWFQPAWEQLNKEDRFVLETFYGDSNEYGNNAASFVSGSLGIEVSSAYKRKNRAIDKLTVLLFGKE